MRRGFACGVWIVRTSGLGPILLQPRVIAAGRNSWRLSVITVSSTGDHRVQRNGVWIGVWCKITAAPGDICRTSVVYGKAFLGVAEFRGNRTPDGGYIAGGMVDPADPPDLHGNRDWVRSRGSLGEDEWSRTFDCFVYERLLRICAIGESPMCWLLRANADQRRGLTTLVGRPDRRLARLRNL